MVLLMGVGLSLGGCDLVTNDKSAEMLGAATLYNATQPTGSAAHALLANDTFKGLTLEIQAIDGFAPTQETLNHLQLFLGRYVNKPDGIRVIVDDPLVAQKSGANGYSIQDVRRIETANRKFYAKKSDIAIYILFLDKASADDVANQATGSHLLGQAHQATSIVIYEDSIRKTSGAGGQQPVWMTETTIVEHELGHLLGLVNNGSPMESNHVDPSGPLAHCKNPKCLMHASVETKAPADPNAVAEIPALDDDCVADLRKNGAK
jgi:hypothetical protein